MKKFKTLLSFAIALCSVGVLSSGGMEVKKVRAEENYCELEFTNPTTKENESVSGYDLSWKAYSNGKTWDIANFNNNRNGWELIKCGREKSASVASITSEKLSNPIGKVSVKLGAFDESKYLAKINSSKLYVASDSSFTTDLQEISNNTITTIDDVDYFEYTIPNPAADMFYKIEYDCQKMGKNGAIQVESVKYYYASLSFSDKFVNNVQTSSQLSFSFNAKSKIENKSATISTSNLVGWKTESSYTERKHKINNTDISIISKVLANKDNLQINTDKGCYLYNDKAFGIAISSIELFWNTANHPSINVYAGNNTISSASSDLKVGVLEYNESLAKSVLDLSSGNYTHFYLELSPYASGSKAAYISSIVVNYKDSVNSYSDYNNMSLNFKTDFDFTGKTQGTDFTEAGMMFIQGSDVSATYSKTTVEALPGDAKTATQTDYSKAFIVRLGDIPVTDWGTDVTVVPYILIDGTYYFGTASATNVIEVAGAYSSSEATITLSDESVVKVKDVAAAIEGYYNSNKNLGE